MLGTDGDGERRDDGQRQWHPQGHAGANARPTVDFDDSADALDVGADHVHADAPARDRGDFLRRRQPGFENQRKLLARRELRGGSLVDDARGDRFLHQPVAVDAAPVVVDVDQDLVAGLARRHGEDADLALAGLEPFGRRLDAVVHGIADDVGQRIADHLDHLAIQFDVATFDIDQHLLAELCREIAHQPRQGHEQVLDPLHAGPGDGVAHLGDDCRQALKGTVDGHFGRRFSKAAGELIAGEHHVGNGAHDPVEQLD